MIFHIFIALFFILYAVNPASVKPNLYRIKPEQWKIGENVTLKWGELPFEADTIAIELLTLTVNKYFIL